MLSVNLGYLSLERKKEYGNTLKDSVLQNPKRCWSFVINPRQNPIKVQVF